MALLDGRAELAVHSLKDVPMELPEGFELAAVMTRADPRDALVSVRYDALEALPADAVVGTSSLRRAAQLKARFPGFRIEPLRAIWIPAWASWMPGSMTPSCWRRRG